MTLSYMHHDSVAAAPVRARAEERENMAVTYAALGTITAVAAIGYGLWRGTPPPLAVFASTLLFLFGAGAAAIEFRAARRLRRHVRTLERYARRA